jgi:hypothetical protein
MYKKWMEEINNPDGNSFIQSKIFAIFGGKLDLSKVKKLKTDTEKFYDEPLVFQNDSFSLGFAAIINPDSYEHSVHKPGHLPRITMLNSERDILYAGAICVAITQIIYLFLLQTYID